MSAPRHLTFFRLCMAILVTLGCNVESYTETAARSRQPMKEI